MKMMVAYIDSQPSQTDDNRIDSQSVNRIVNSCTEISTCVSDDQDQ